MVLHCLSAKATDITSFRTAFLRQIMVLRDRVHVGLDFLPVCIQEQFLEMEICFMSG